MSLKLVLAANMAVVVLESLFYGLLLVSASTTLYLRFSRHEVPKLLFWNPVVLFTVFISVTSGAHWILTIVRFFHAFLGSADTSRFYLDYSQVTQTARSLLCIAAVFIGDAAIVSLPSFVYNLNAHDELKIHRLWLIWNRSLPVIIIPVVTCLGLAVNGCTLTYLSAQPAFAGQAKASWVLTLVTNLYCTALIIWKIWRTKRTVEHLLGDGTLVPVLIILLESAAVWTICGLLFAITSSIRSPFQVIFTDLSPSVVGLVNTVIYLRVEFQLTRPPASNRPASIIPYFVNRVSTQISRGAA
ncbi:hypothetical protein B0H16DRAFT_1691552 [Mycena metata]|uniref:Uncharacterized protein n=1 Tax=Mycena metata TaxID=1033252 RepID=A0AAD7N7Z2_9AGAR|nr:hypothetical protein B0H16DRAFT_1691552 [Mycena metata]